MMQLLVEREAKAREASEAANARTNEVLLKIALERPAATNQLELARDWFEFGKSAQTPREESGSLKEAFELLKEEIKARGGGKGESKSDDLPVEVIVNGLVAAMNLFNNKRAASQAAQQPAPAPQQPAPAPQAPEPPPYAPIPVYIDPSGTKYVYVSGLGYCPVVEPAAMQYPHPTPVPPPYPYPSPQPYPYQHYAYPHVQPPPTAPPAAPVFQPPPPPAAPVTPPMYQPPPPPAAPVTPPAAPVTPPAAPVYQPPPNAYQQPIAPPAAPVAPPSASPAAPVLPVAPIAHPPQPSAPMAKPMNDTYPPPPMAAPAPEQFVNVPVPASPVAPAALIPRGTHPWGRIAEPAHEGSSDTNEAADDPEPEFPLDALAAITNDHSGAVPSDFMETIASAMQGPEMQAIMNIPEIRALHKAAHKGEISGEEAQAKAAQFFKRAAGGNS
ncbi:hypothetical protein GF068_42185 [Polyangium spumosum]|uniref:Uncharacterized protein n=2 Tax=Polyangium spumosum TaxID=889282 RepID=A0A6N7Q6E6_9BACT|nr:hypothetical protein [Polyangium spumosum]